MNRKMEGLKEESLQFSHVSSKKIKSFVIQPCFPFPQPFPFLSNLGKKKKTMRERTKVEELALLFSLWGKSIFYTITGLPTLCIFPLYLKRNPWDHSKPWQWANSFSQYLPQARAFCAMVNIIWVIQFGKFYKNIFYVLGTIDSQG